MPDDLGELEGQLSVFPRQCEAYGGRNHRTHRLSHYSITKDIETVIGPVHVDHQRCVDCGRQFRRMGIGSYSGYRAIADWELTSSQPPVPTQEPAPVSSHLPPPLSAFLPKKGW